MYSTMDVYQCIHSTETYQCHIATDGWCFHSKGTHIFDLVQTAANLNRACAGLRWKYNSRSIINGLIDWMGINIPIKLSAHNIPMYKYYFPGRLTSCFWFYDVSCVQLLVATIDFPFEQFWKGNVLESSGLSLEDTNQATTAWRQLPREQLLWWLAPRRGLVARFLLLECYFDI